MKMEMDSIQFLPKNKLEFQEIVKESLSIPFKSTRFIIFTTLTTLPFFCFLVFFEIILQKTFFNTTNILFASNDFDEYYLYLRDDWSPFNSTKKLTKTLSPHFILLLLLFLIPYNLLELLSITTVVELASNSYLEERSLSFKDLIKKIFNATKIRGRLITYMYSFLLSTSTLFGLIWVVTNFFALSKGISSYYDYYHYFDSYYKPISFTFVYALNVILHGAGFVLLLMKYMEWNAGWNTSVVVSILEEEYGVDAFELSAYFSRGINRHGPVLMLVFFSWVVSLRLPCLFWGCYKSMGGVALIFIYTGLICAGNVLKWVVCVMYFFDCKKRTMEKKIDEEIGREGTQASANEKKQKSRSMNAENGNQPSLSVPLTLDHS